MSELAPRPLLESVFAAAVDAVDAGACVARALERTTLPGGGIRVLAAGKAAAPMARAAADGLGDRIREGLVITKPGHGELSPWRPIEAGHPVPDARSAAAGEAALALAHRCSRSETLLVLLSGGASALLSLPAPGVAVASLGRATELLLSGGADIETLNAVRRHLTRVSGGRLARASRAGRIRVLAISDVPGDDPAVLASGPCAGDPSRFDDAIHGIDALGLRQALPGDVRVHLEAGLSGDREESVKPNDPLLDRVETRVLANLDDAIEAAVRAAERLGVRAVHVPGELEGEASRAGRRIAALGLALAEGRGPTLAVLGGETTVTVQGDGRGGRCQELALAAALGLAGGSDAVTLLAAGTDGSDGPTDAAGAFADAESVARGHRAGRDARDDLARNDAHGFFEAEGGLLRTGPTGTNVRDIVLVLRHGPGEASPRA